MRLISLYADLPGTTFYKDAACRLRGACVSLGIPHIIERRESAGSWLQNVHLKPFFIRDVHRELGSVLWVDVDSGLHGDPIPEARRSLEGYDAVFPKCAYLRGTDPENPKVLPKDDMRATIFTSLRIMGIAHAYADTEGARILLDRWCELSSSSIAEVRGDHRCLQLALDELEISGDVKWGYLPERSFGKQGTIVSLGRAVGVPGRGKAMKDAKGYCNKIRRSKKGEDQ